MFNKKKPKKVYMGDVIKQHQEIFYEDNYYTTVYNLFRDLVKAAILESDVNCDIEILKRGIIEEIEKEFEEEHEGLIRLRPCPQCSLSLSHPIRYRVIEDWQDLSRE